MVAARATRGEFMKISLLILGVLCGLAISSWQAKAQTYETNNVFVQTFAGSGFSGYLDGQGTQTMFNNPNVIAADSANNLFVLDSNKYLIRKITPNGTVTTFAGGGNQMAGYGTNATVFYGGGSSMIIDHSNVLWISTPNGFLVRVGTDAYVSSTLLSGTAVPWGVCADSQNNIYISDSQGNKIWRYRTNAVLEVFAGSGNSGAIDGNGVFTSFTTPTALAADAADNIYVWDSGNYKIRRINQNRDVVTITGGPSSNTDGQNPSFNSVSAMGVDSFGNLILACGSAIRKMSVKTNAVTLAGSFTQTAYTNGAGNLARFNGAFGVCVVGGTIYVADMSNQRIRSITNNPSAQVVSSANLGIGTFAGVTITGTVGRTYQVQSSTDTTSWTTRATLLLTSSPYLWIDQNPVSGNKFYRAVMLP